MTRPAKTSALRDHVDHLMDGWARERPDLNVAPLAVIQRVLRLAAYLAMELEPVFA
jgi:hypothetical protein